MDLDLPDYPTETRALWRECCGQCDCGGSVMATEIGLAVVDCEGFMVEVTL